MTHEKTYVINLVKYAPHKYHGVFRPRFVYAKNYKEAAKKLKVSPYAMRTYGHIQ